MNKKVKEEILKSCPICGDKVEQQKDNRGDLIICGKTKDVMVKIPHFMLYK